MTLTAGITFATIFDNITLFEKFHTYQDWGFILVSRPDTGTPVPRTYKVEIPGADGDLDLTEATTGEVKYGNRQMNFKLRAMIPLEEQEQLKSDIYNAIHGRKMAIYLDEDPDHYYTGRVEVKSFKRSCCKVDMEITVDAEPFKIDEDYTIMKFTVEPSSDVEDIELNALPYSKVGTTQIIYDNFHHALYQYIYNFSHFSDITVHFRSPPFATTIRPIIEIIGIANDRNDGSMNTYHYQMTSAEYTSGSFSISTIDLRDVYHIDISQIKTIKIQNDNNVYLTGHGVSRKMVYIRNGKKRVIPSFRCDTDNITMIYMGEEYTLNSWPESFDEIFLSSGFNEFGFINLNNNTATISIEYRQGWL